MDEEKSWRKSNFIWLHYMRVNISYGRKDGKRLMKLSVIIVSYENCEILRDCLDSIKKFNDLKDEAEIIISDNSITNSVYEMVKKDYPEIQIIKNNNIGFGPANNRAVDISSGEYLFFLNPDTILLEPIFQFAVDKFEQQSNLALFGIKLMNVNGTANNSFFAMDNYTLSWTLLMKAFSKFDIYIDGKMYIAGADLFVRKSAFEAAGCFDENIFMYYEEPDLIKRIKKLPNNYITSFFPEKKMIHLEGATEKKDAISTVKKVERSLATYRYYCDKWNISFIRNIRQMRKYQVLKKNVSGFTGNGENVRLAKMQIELLDKLIVG